MLHLLDTNQMAGTEKHVLELMAALVDVDVGVAPYLACRPDSPLNQAAGDQQFPVLPVLGRFHPLRTRSSITRVIKENSIDLVHAHNGRMMLAAALARRQASTPVVATQHFVEPQFASYKGIKRFMALRAHHWVNGQLAHIIATSEAAREAMINRRKCGPDPHYVNPKWH